MDDQVSGIIPNQWEADTQPIGYAGYVRQPDTNIISHFYVNVKLVVLTQTLAPSTSRRLKHGDLTGSVKKWQRSHKIRMLSVCCIGINFPSFFLSKNEKKWVGDCQNQDFQQGRGTGTPPNRIFRSGCPC